ncbi:DNA (cytosine-5-)-methyltransferase [Candidatus Altiarchaeales archaeon WOR_SM1_SCG]|nr:DNA (cytosine-5-)-methyltransferase [Candidatus Altiarchaeales archaeon WOR_SM1_SCG]
MENNEENNLKAIDFFCGAGGMTFGLSQSGINVLAGIDNDPSCKETYEINNPGSEFIETDIHKLSEKHLAELTGIKKDDDSLLFVGCSPCQYWSIIRTDKKKSEKSKDLLKVFHHFVKYHNPGYVVVENVPGIERKKDESGLIEFVGYLEKQGYKVKYDIINLNEFGVPQTRKRFSLIASRVTKTPIFPETDKHKKLTVKDFIGEHNGFPEVNAGFKDNSEFNHTVARLSEKNIKRLEKTPKNGGSWLDWANHTNLKREHYNGNGFKDNYGRMSWDKPAPTITTKFLSISNGRFGHPEENRAISIREGATLQTFPKNYVFYSKSIGATARMIGNAVPPEYARRIGEAIINKST